MWITYTGSASARYHHNGIGQTVALEPVILNFENANARPTADPSAVARVADKAGK